MNIPDEAAKRYPILRAFPDEFARMLLRKAFTAGAEWARKEALREAIEAVESTYNDTHDVYQAPVLAIRALADGSL